MWHGLAREVRFGRLGAAWSGRAWRGRARLGTAVMARFVWVAFGEVR